MEAVKDGNKIYWVEGEKCADKLWTIGIPATTTIGGSGGFDRYGDYSQVLHGVKLVLCPDADVPGYKYMDQVYKAYPDSQWLYPLPGDLESGKDIADWIKDGATQEQILAAVGEKLDFELPTKKLSKGKCLDTDTLLGAVKELLGKDLLGSQLQVTFVALASEFGRPITEIKEIYKLLKQERDNEFAQKDTLQNDIPRLLAASSQRLNPLNYFWGDGGVLAEILEDEAKAKKIPVEFLITTFIAVAGSLLPAGSKAVIKVSGRYTVAPIFRTLVVAPTGRKKTPAQQAIIGPLEDIETDAIALWKAEKAAYEQALKSANGEIVEKPQPCRQYILSDSTIEALIQTHSENPRGLLFYKDEAAAFISAQNMYRGGIGDDAQIDLAEFNGKRLKKNRAGSDLIAIDRTHVCRTGSIQTGTLQKLMGDHEDTTGAWARWLICAASTEPAYIDLSGDDFDTNLHHYLTVVYQRLLTLKDEDYLLSREAKDIFEPYQHQLTRWLEVEPNEGIKAAYTKAETYMGRLALLLHLVNAKLAGEDVNPEPVINARVMSAAKSLIDYFVGQMLLLHSTNAPGKEVTGNMLRLREWIIKKWKKPVSAREVKQYGPNSPFRKMPTLEIQGYLNQLAKGGYGSFEGGIYTTDLSGAKDGEYGQL